MKKQIRLNILPTRYKFRIAIVGLCLLVNTWAIAALTPKQKISLTHTKIDTEKLNLSFIQQESIATKKANTLEKPATSQPLSLPEKKHQEPPTNQVNTTTLAPNNKDTEKRKSKSELNEQSDTVTKPDNIVGIDISAQQKKQDILGNKHVTNTLSQTSKTQNPLINEPSFSKPPEQPRYPSLARKRGQQGTVWLEVWLDTAGEQIKREVKESSGIEILDKAALEAVSRWQFLPYSQENISIASRVRIPVQFVLN